MAATKQGNDVGVSQEGLHRGYATRASRRL